MRYLAICLLLVTTTTASADERGFRFTTTESLLPAMRNIVITKANEPGPDRVKHRAVASTDQYKTVVKVSAEGPFDVWWVPKKGIPIRALVGIAPKENEVKDVALDRLLGVITVRGENQPRASRITLTSQEDPGPNEKGHQPIQLANDYRVDMVVPEGFYAVWITPENGAAAKKAMDRIKVQAGKVVTVD